MREVLSKVIILMCVTSDRRIQYKSEFNYLELFNKYSTKREAFKVCRKKNV